MPIPFTVQPNLTQDKSMFESTFHGIIQDNQKPFRMDDLKGSNVNIAKEVGNQPMNNITEGMCQAQPCSISVDYRYTTGGRS